MGTLLPEEDAPFPYTWWLTEISSLWDFFQQASCQFGFSRWALFIRIWIWIWNSSDMPTPKFVIICPSKLLGPCEEHLNPQTLRNIDNKFSPQSSFLDEWHPDTLLSWVLSIQWNSAQLKTDLVFTCRANSNLLKTPWPFLFIRQQYEYMQLFLFGSFVADYMLLKEP